MGQSRTPVVLGVLAMIFGGLVALWQGANLAVQLALGGSARVLQQLLVRAPANPNAPDPSLVLARVEELQRELKPYTLTVSGAMAVLSLLLFLVGVGLYRRRAWARPAALLWAAAALGWLPFMLAIQVRVVQPRTHEVMAPLLVGAPTKVGGAEGAVSGQRWTPQQVAMMHTLQRSAGSALQVILFAPFPLVLAALMGRRSAREDLSS